MKILLIVFALLGLNAYEIPKLVVNEDKKPEIVLFDAKSMIINNKPSYLIEWKTINATDVNITFFGKVKLEGNVTVTNDEYNRGPITMQASSKDSSYIDIIVINNQDPSSKKIMPIRQEVENDYYEPIPYYPRTIRRPARALRRGYY